MVNLSAHAGSTAGISSTCRASGSTTEHSTQLSSMIVALALATLQAVSPAQVHILLLLSTVNLQQFLLADDFLSVWLALVHNGN